jgi:hypothetical protein
MFQFRLRSLLAVMLAVAVCSWIIYGSPQWLGLFAIWLLYLLLPAATLAGIVFHRRDWRAFFVGLSPWVVAFSIWMFIVLIDEIRDLSDIVQLLDPGEYSDATEVIRIKSLLLIPLGLMILCGLCSVVIYWWAERRQAQRGTRPH